MSHHKSGKKYCGLVLLLVVILEALLEAIVVETSHVKCTSG